MSSNNNKKRNNNNNNKPERIHTVLESFINVGISILILIIVIMIYRFLIKDDYNYNDNYYTKIFEEGFQTETSKNKNTTRTTSNTIYEQSLTKLYRTNTRLICSMIPSNGGESSLCYINNEPVVIYNFPIHMIKLIDGTILAVFNDGRLYQKDSMLSTIWNGPITNSLPQDIIPLRMITLSTDLISLLGVGYDNILYIKTPTSDGQINLSGVWKQVPNNSSIIYVLFDNTTNYLLSIDINGKLFTKTSLDISSNNQELITKLDRPILRLYYDLNDYMLIIDNNFDLYQFNDINWKTSSLNVSRGANASKIQDLLYDNDGKMYGLVFNPDAFMVQIMKQNAIFYLANFTPLDLQLSQDISGDFIMSNQNIIKCKVGSLYSYLKNANIDETNDDDPNFAYQKQVIETQGKLREFCAKRSASTGFINSDNYELLASVEKNNDTINKLQNIVDNLKTYETN